MKCRVCKGERLSLFYDQGDKGQFRFYKCRDCGLVNLDLSGLTIADHQGKYFARFEPIEDYE